MRLRAAAIVLALLPGFAWGQDGAVLAARTALAELEAAGRALETAEASRDRIGALSQVIRAYESALSALREGMRQAAIREAVLTRGLEAESARVSQLLGALETLGTTPETLLPLHPQGPLGSVRAGMLIAAVTPDLQARVVELRGRLEELREIRMLQEAAAVTLDQGLRRAQAARAELAEAMSRRSDVPRKAGQDEGELARLAASAETLAAFAQGLSALDPTEARAVPRPTEGFALPVHGRVLRRYGQTDAAGIARPGLVIATEPLALVTAPFPATIRYAGPLLDYGNVMFLEPDPHTLLVLAGLGQVYGAVGQVIPAGTPVGQMGGLAPTSEEFLTESAEGGGAGRTETLYLELRQDNRAVDPTGWFAGTKDEIR